MFALIGALISGMVGLIGPAVGAAGGLLGGAFSALGTASGLGGAAFSTIGTGAGPVLATIGKLGVGAVEVAGQAAGAAGKAAAGGIGVLGGLPAAATTTIDSLGALMPTVTSGVQAYQTFFGEEPAGPADYRASGVAPAQPAPAIIQLPTLGGQQPLVITPPAAGPAAQPDYLLYAGIALAAIILLRNK